MDCAVAPALLCGRRPLQPTLATVTPKSPRIEVPSIRRQEGVGVHATGKDDHIGRYFPAAGMFGAALGNFRKGLPEAESNAKAPHL